jgi:hypothetical protein
MFQRFIFIRPMVKRFVTAAFSLVAASVATAQSPPEMRMTPAEIQTSALDSNQIGSSGLPGVHTKIVFGDPSKVGFERRFWRTLAEPTTIFVHWDISSWVFSHSRRATATERHAAVCVSGGLLL